MGIAHAALIVPFWRQLEKPEEPKPKSPELKKLEELDQPAELEKSEELNDDPDPVPTNWEKRFTDLWKSLSHNEKALVVAILRSPQPV